MSKRIGTDYIYHTFHNYGQEYVDITNLDLPDNIKSSGVAYHTQIENDMLKFSCLVEKTDFMQCLLEL